MNRRAGAGLEVDERTDIWSFGCVLYEMLTVRGMGGDAVSDTIAAVLRDELDWHRLARLYQRAPFSSAAAKGCASAAGGRMDGTLRFRRACVLWRICCGATDHRRESRSPRGVVIAGVMLRLQRAGEDLVRRGCDSRATTVCSGGQTRDHDATDRRLVAGNLADGQKVVFAGNSEGQTRLWLRALNDVSVRMLRGTKVGDGGCHSGRQWPMDSVLR